MLIPPPLAPGSVVRVVAPASPFEPRLVWRGLGWLRERYRVRFDRTIFDRSGYLAGSDELRMGALRAALEEADVAAVLCARGGYGALRFAHRLDWSALRRSPRWIVGFSDITVFHLEAARQGVASLHACHVTALGRGDARTRAAVVDALERPTAPRVFRGLGTVVAGTAQGPLSGGNLTILHACAVAGRLALPPGCVLLIEDVGERPYRIDRMLTTLSLGGHLAPAAAVVLGEFCQCEAGPDGVSAERVLAERLAALGVPVLSGLPVGHGLRNDPLVLGAEAVVTAGALEGSLQIGGTSSCAR